MPHRYPLQLTLLTLLTTLLLTASTFADPDPGADPNPVNLQPQLTPGSTTRYHVWSLREQTETLDLDGDQQSYSTTFESQAEITWTIDRLDPDGSAQCTMTLDWISLDLTLPDGTVQHCDSRDAQGDNPILQQFIKANADAPIQTTVAPDGSILSVQGVDAIARQLPQGIPAPQDIDFLESASELATLPAAPLIADPGDQWNATFTWRRPLGQLRVNAVYQLDSVQEIEGVPIATISSTADLALEPDLDNLPQPPHGQQVDLDVQLLQGDMQSQIMFDLQRRQAVGRNATETRHTRVTVTMPDQTLTRDIEESIHSQVLRIAEE